MIEEMNDSMSTMVLVGLSQSEWESLMKYIAFHKYEEVKELDIIVKKLINQIY